jgi:peptide/nickel transport system permease protein
MHDDSIRGATRHDERSFTIERADVIATESEPEPSGAPEVPESIAALTTRQLAWRRFRRHKLAIISTGVLIILTLACIIGPLISRYNYHQLDLLHLTQKPSRLHWFGTDNLGRDEFVRVLYGGRISLTVGLAVALSAGIVGASVGSYAGYYGGWVDNILMRVTDLFLAFPFLVILIIASRLFGGSVLDIVILLTLFFWMADARIVRGVFLSMKEKEFIEAARASGASDKRIIFYHMLPNAMGPIIVSVTLGVAAAILTESALSFLGFGIQPPTPSWGNLLDEAQSAALTAPHLVWFPGLMILATVLCVNYLGDGLRDALDPHGKVSDTA